ncbi:hypothetical protein OQO70_004193 [Citrobacter freundii]|nr:hypothetical protein [Citrobacter freundii]EKW6716185.1 hypothetical protein [Citrobacter freundii]HEP0934979.1 hypothetical protein [Enterobacter roggenkampii]
MKKLKRKRTTCAKNAGCSNSRTIEKKFPLSDNQLRTVGLTASLFSIYRSAKELGWFENLPVIWEMLGTEFAVFYHFIEKFI